MAKRVPKEGWRKYDKRMVFPIEAVIVRPAWRTEGTDRFTACLYVGKKGSRNPRGRASVCAKATNPRVAIGRAMKDLGQKLEDRYFKGKAGGVFEGVRRKRRR